MPTLHELEFSLEKKFSSNSWQVSELITDNQRSQFSKKIIFTPLLAIHFLSFVSTALSKKISKQVFDLLSNQKFTNRLSWNYLLSDNHKTYPDDLDSTTLASHTAWKLITSNRERILMAFINQLTCQETKPGGPYRTWFFDKNNELWGKDVDLVTNFRIWKFLQELKITLPSLKNWLLLQISQQKTSLYYPTFETNFISLRLVKSPSFDTYSPANYYQLARFISTLLSRPDHTLFLPELFKHYEQLLAAPLSELNAFPAFLDHTVGKQHYWVGSAFLTQCACAQAIYAYQTALTNQIASLHQQKLLQKLTLSVKKNLHTLSGKYHLLAYQYNSPFISIDSPALCLFPPPTIFTKSNQIERLWETLSSATIIGWTSYALHDECVDDNTDSEKIVLSRILSHVSLTTFLHFLTNHNQPDFLKHWLISVYQKMEQTYIFDTHKDTSLLPDQGWNQHIFERAQGLIIAPILLQHIVEPTITNIEVAEKIYQPLIIARQLFDDLLDWQTDWSAQRATPITWKVNQLLTKTNTTSSPIKLSNLVNTQIVPEILMNISELLEQGKHQLKTTKMGILVESLQPELQKLTKKLIEIRAEQKLLTALTSHYQHTPTPPPPPPLESDPTHLPVASPP